MKAEASFILNKAAINKIDGTEARHYSELAEEAARNAAADAEHIEEAAAKIDEIEDDIEDLQEAIGGVDSGLVKRVSDLEVVANDPVYNVSESKLQLYDILNGQIPISFDDSKFMDITPGSYETDYPLYASSAHRYGTAVTDMYIDKPQSNSKYFIGFMGISTNNRYSGYDQATTAELVLVEYNPDAVFSLYNDNFGTNKTTFAWVWKSSAYKQAAKVTVISTNDVNNLRVVYARYTLVPEPGYSGQMTAFQKYLSDGSKLNFTAFMAWADYTVDLALETLDFSADIPQKDMKQLYVADTIYNPVDSQARSDISDLSDLTVDIMNDITALENAISTGDTNLKGSEPPSNSVGANGAIYTMTKTVNSVDYVVVFVKTNGTWVPVSHNIPKPESWEDVQTLVANGLHLYVFKIGEQLTCKKGTQTLTWDIVDMDNPDTLTANNWSHNMALCLHETYADMPFDAREAFYYSENGLEAGTYNFTFGNHSWVSTDVDKTFEFTLTQALPAGGQLVMTQPYNMTAEGGIIKSYASSVDTTEIESVTMTEGSNGTSLGTITNGKQTAFNSCQRALLGNNNYKESNVRTWLNSDAAAGSVYSPQNIWDRPGTLYNTAAGFKNGIDADFLTVLATTTYVTARNNISDGGGSDTANDIFFLLSREQIYGSKEVSTVNEGAQMEYFKTATNRIKYNGSTVKYWWLRTPGAGRAYSVRNVDTSGSLNNSNAYNTSGVVPACNIASANQ